MYVDPTGEQALIWHGVPKGVPGVSSLCISNPWICGPTLAGVGAFAAGTLIYPSIALPLGDAIDWCMKDDTKDCDKEWDWAYARCEQLIQSGNDNWREIGKRPPTLYSCAKGYVSQRCGGNRVN